MNLISKRTLAPRSEHPLHTRLVAAPVGVDTNAIAAASAGGADCAGTALIIRRALGIVAAARVAEIAASKAARAASHTEACTGGAAAGLSEVVACLGS